MKNSGKVVKVILDIKNKFNVYYYSVHSLNKKKSIPLYLHHYLSPNHEIRYSRKN